MCVPQQLKDILDDYDDDADGALELLEAERLLEDVWTLVMAQQVGGRVCCAVLVNAMGRDCSPSLGRSVCCRGPHSVSAHTAMLVEVGRRGAAGIRLAPPVARLSRRDCLADRRSSGKLPCTSLPFSVPRPLLQDVAAWTPAEAADALKVSSHKYTHCDLCMATAVRGQY